MDRHQKLFEKMVEHDGGNAHRIQHFTKVHAFARWIGLAEGLDEGTRYILESAALVHDIGIKAALSQYGSAAGKYQEKEGEKLASQMLQALKYPPEVVERVAYLVGHHHTYSDINGEDYRILVEADFLVNMHEGAMAKETVAQTMEKMFRTKTGIALCKKMFGL